MRNSAGSQRPPLVLIASDQEWSARSFESIIGPRGYAVLRAYTGRQAIEMAAQSQPDLLIIDVRLPDLDGIDVCRKVQEDGLGASTPIVITAAAQLTRSQRLAAYKAGAWGICSQPLDAEVLVAMLDTFMRSKLDVERMRAESLLDDATGLYNLRGLVRRARELGAIAYRQHDPLACVALSPRLPASAERGDGTEEVSDDLALRVGDMVRRAGRASDAIGRLGPADFVIIAPATRADGARRIVERLSSVIASEPLPEGEHVRLAGGYYAVDDFAEAAVDAEEMVLRAAAALRHGRSTTPESPIVAFEEISLQDAP
jgi:PleD family two-component response regulator